MSSNAKCLHWNVIRWQSDIVNLPILKYKSLVIRPLFRTISFIYMVSTSFIKIFNLFSISGCRSIRTFFFVMESNQFLIKCLLIYCRWKSMSCSVWQKQIHCYLKNINLYLLYCSLCQWTTLINNQTLSQHNW